MIVYCCADLIFSTRVRSTAEALGVPSRPVRNVEMLQSRLDCVDDGRLNEPVDALFVDLDTGDQGIALISHARQHDATLPIVAFGSHVAVDLLDAARAAGADTVLPRSAFSARLPELLRQYHSKA